MQKDYSEHQKKYLEWRKERESKKHNQIQSSYPGKDPVFSKITILKLFRDEEERILGALSLGDDRRKGREKIPPYIIRHLFMVRLRDLLNKGYLATDQNDEIHITSHGLDYIAREDKEIFKLTI